MSFSIKGISLHYYKFGSASVISKVLTRESGLESFVVKGIRGKNPKNNIHLLHPLSVLELEVSNNKSGSLKYVKEMRSSIPLKEIFNSMHKKFLSMYIAEVLLRVLVESKEEKDLYNFIEEKTVEIEKSKKLNKNNALIFLIELSNYLGFYPNISNSQKKYFNLDLGEFSDLDSPYNISSKNKDYLCSLIKDKSTNIPYENRKELMVNLQQYYKLNHYNIDKMNSQKVIESFRG